MWIHAYVIILHTGILSCSWCAEKICWRCTVQSSHCTAVQETRRGRRWKRGCPFRSRMPQAISDTIGWAGGWARGDVDHLHQEIICHRGGEGCKHSTSLYQLLECITVRDASFLLQVVCKQVWKGEVFTCPWIVFFAPKVRFVHRTLTSDTILAYKMFHLCIG